MASCSLGDSAGKNAGCGFDQYNRKILFRIDAIEAVSDQAARGAMHLGGKLHPVAPAPTIAMCSCPGASGTCWTWAFRKSRSKRVADGPPGGGRRERRNAPSPRPRQSRSPYCRPQAPACHRRKPPGHDLLTILIQHRGEPDIFLTLIQPDHLALNETEVIGFGMAQIVDAITVRIERPGGDLVKQRLPDMG